MSSVVAVQPLSQEGEAEARRLSLALGLPLLEPAVRPPGKLLALLLVGPEGLALQPLGPRSSGPVSVDFAAPALRHRRRGGQNELLGRALGVNRLPGMRVLDATAGLARDAAVLADLGCELLLAEREPLVAALLQAGLSRGALSEDPWVRGLVSRMRLHCGDARTLAPEELAGLDAIYLDPMFPERRKSAAVRKEMALLQTLLDSGAPETGETLLRWALDAPVARVVVKRPLRAAYLADLAPSHSLRGKAVRFDVHVLRSLTPQARPEADA